MVQLGHEGAEAAEGGCDCVELHLNSSGSKCNQPIDACRSCARSPAHVLCNEYDSSYLSASACRNWGAISALWFLMSLILKLCGNHSLQAPLPKTTAGLRLLAFLAELASNSLSIEGHPNPMESSQHTKVCVFCALCIWEQPRLAMPAHTAETSLAICQVNRKHADCSRRPAIEQQQHCGNLHFVHASIYRAANVMMWSNKNRRKQNAFNSMQLAHLQQGVAWLIEHVVRSMQAKRQLAVCSALP